MSLPAAGIYSLRFIGHANDFDGELILNRNSSYRNDNGRNGSIDYRTNNVSIESEVIRIQDARFTIDEVSEDGLVGI